MIEGGDAIAILLKEAGGHRWQRVPPNEKRGRVHTSTVTVAAFECAAESEWRLDERDIEVFTTKDTGPGGQHRNKTESCVVMRHKPTGIEAKASSRSQHQNRKTARTILEARVRAARDGESAAGLAADRKKQVGTAMRGDKIRTYRDQDDTATDHRSGRKARLSRVLRGQLDLLG